MTEIPIRKPKNNSEPGFFLYKKAWQNQSPTIFHFSVNSIEDSFPDKVSVIFLPFPRISAKAFLYP